MPGISNIVRAGRLPHMLSGEVDAEVRECEGVREISDRAALTIASYWQSPAGSGRAFAQLTSTGAVDIEELHAAIADVYAEAKRLGGTNALCLDMLATWASNHPSRSIG